MSRAGRDDFVVTPPKKNGMLLIGIGILGTIFIIILIGGGILVLSNMPNSPPPTFSTPFPNMIANITYPISSPIPIINNTSSSNVNASINESQQVEPDANDFWKAKYDELVNSTGNGTYGVPIKGINNATGLPYYNPLATPTP